MQGARSWWSKSQLEGQFCRGPTNSSMFHCTSWHILNGKLTWLRTLIFKDVWNLWFCFLIHAFVVGLRPDVLCASVHHNKDEILKKARIPERAIAFIYCVMLSMVKWCKSNLPWGMPAALEFGVRVMGEHKKQNAIPSTVRFCRHNSGPITIRNHHSTFDYAIPFSYLPE